MAHVSADSLRSMMPSSLDLPFRLLDARGVTPSEEPLADDFLHRQVHIEIEEPVAEAHLTRQVAILRNQLRFAGITLGQIFDDDAGLGHHLVPAFIAQNGELAEGPHLLEGRGGRRIGEIHEFALEGRPVFIKRDQNLLTEGGEGVEVEFQGHGRPTCCYASACATRLAASRN
jgi:hypothetical protein